MEEIFANKQDGCATPRSPWERRFWKRAGRRKADGVSGTHQWLLKRAEDKCRPLSLTWSAVRVSRSCSESSSRSHSSHFVCPPAVPGAPPRRVEVEILNSTAIKVMWRSLTPGRQNGQIRGYQVHYVRVENGESRGLPFIKDVMLADAQVRPSRSFLLFSAVVSLPKQLKITDPDTEM